MIDSSPLSQTLVSLWLGDVSVLICDSQLLFKQQTLYMTSEPSVADVSPLVSPSPLHWCGHLNPKADVSRAGWRFDNGHTRPLNKPLTRSLLSKAIPICHLTPWGKIFQCALCHTLSSSGAGLLPFPKGIMLSHGFCLCPSSHRHAWILPPSIFPPLCLSPTSVRFPTAMPESHLYPLPTAVPESQGSCSFLKSCLGITLSEKPSPTTKFLLHLSGVILRWMSHSLGTVQ